MTRVEILPDPHGGKRVEQLFHSSYEKREAPLEEMQLPGDHCEMGIENRFILRAV